MRGPQNTHTHTSHPRRHHQSRHHPTTTWTIQPTHTQRFGHSLLATKNRLHYSAEQNTTQNNATPQANSKPIFSRVILQAALYTLHHHTPVTLCLQSNQLRTRALQHVPLDKSSTHTHVQPSPLPVPHLAWRKSSPVNCFPELGSVSPNVHV